MQTRREFLVMSAGVACAVSVPSLVWAKAGNAALNATAITQVLGDGVQMVAVAVEFADELTVADVKVQADTATLGTLLIALSRFESGCLHRLSVR